MQTTAIADSNNTRTVTGWYGNTEEFCRCDKYCPCCGKLKEQIYYTTSGYASTVMDLSENEKIQLNNKQLEMKFNS